VTSALRRRVRAQEALPAHSEWWVRVSAVGGEGGEGPVSDAVTVGPGPTEQPPAAPLHAPTVHAATSSTVDVGWSAPPDNGAAILSYQVALTLLAHGQEQNVQTLDVLMRSDTTQAADVPAVPRRAHLRCLLLGHDYRVRVCATCLCRPRRRVTEVAADCRGVCMECSEQLGVTGMDWHAASTQVRARSMFGWGEWSAPLQHMPLRGGSGTPLYGGGQRQVKKVAGVERVRWRQDPDAGWAADAAEAAYCGWAPPAPDPPVGTNALQGSWMTTGTSTRADVPAAPPSPPQPWRAALEIHSEESRRGTIVQGGRDSGESALVRRARQARDHQTLQRGHGDGDGGWGV
jgi:hypothetical protein